jgi:hypothetical protein
MNDDVPCYLTAREDEQHGIGIRTPAFFLEDCLRRVIDSSNPGLRASVWKGFPEEYRFAQNQIKKP